MSKRVGIHGETWHAGPGVTDKGLETQIHEGVSADVAKLALQRGYLFDYPWRLNGKNKIDRSISRYVFMENESVLSRVVRKGTIRKSTIVRALRLWDRGGQLHAEGRHSLANQALALKRTVEDVQNVKRNAVTGCLWVLELIIWTRKLVFSVLECFG